MLLVGQGSKVLAISGTPATADLVDCPFMRDIWRHIVRERLGGRLHGGLRWEHTNSRGLTERGDVEGWKRHDGGSMVLVVVILVCKTKVRASSLTIRGEGY